MDFTTDSVRLIIPLGLFGIEPRLDRSLPVAVPRSLPCLPRSWRDPETLIGSLEESAHRARSLTIYSDLVGIEHLIRMLARRVANEFCLLDRFFAEGTAGPKDRNRK